MSAFRIALQPIVPVGDGMLGRDKVKGHRCKDAAAATSTLRYAMSSEAAFHLAGHAVATSVSRYHVLAAPLKVETYGTGEITAALSRRKLREALKVAEVSARTDPEVAAGIAVILCAGLASEQHAASLGIDVAVHKERSAGDFAAAREELKLAGLSDDTEPYVATARALVADRWAYVESVARRLMLVSELHHSEVEEIIDDIAKTS